MIFTALKIGQFDDNCKALHSIAYIELSQIAINDFCCVILVGSHMFELRMHQTTPNAKVDRDTLRRLLCLEWSCRERFAYLIPLQQRIGTDEC